MTDQLTLTSSDLLYETLYELARGNMLSLANVMNHIYMYISGASAGSVRK